MFTCLGPCSFLPPASQARASQLQLTVITVHTSVHTCSDSIMHSCFVGRDGEQLSIMASSSKFELVGKSWYRNLLTFVHASFDTSRNSVCNGTVPIFPLSVHLELVLKYF